MMQGKIKTVNQSQGDCTQFQLEKTLLAKAKKILHIYQFT